MGSMNFHFKPTGASVLPSRDFEVIINKQPVLASMGREVRTTLSQLEPELANLMLNQYAEPQDSLVQSIQAALIERELSIDIDENSLDTGYFNGATQRRMDEVGLSSSDDWDIPSI